MRTTRWQDTPQRYGLVSRILHWAVAYLLVWQFVTILGWRILGDGPFMRAVWQLGPYHGTVGVLVLALFVPRLLWTLASRDRRRREDASWRWALARLVHALLYGLMFVVPALALLRAYAAGKGYELWGLAIVPATGVERPWLAAPADRLHGPLAWALATLIAGHAVMAVLPAGRGGAAAIGRMAGRLRPKPRRDARTQR